MNVVTAQPIRSIAVLGAGAWGTALAVHFSRHIDTMLWSWQPDHVREMIEQRENRRFFPGVVLPSSLALTDALSETESADIIVIAVPTGALPSLFSTYQPAAHQALILACKGFVLNEQSGPQLGYAFVEQNVPESCPVGVLSGPSFAQELAEGKPTAVTLAFKEACLASKIANALHISPLRVYSTDDRIGVSVGGAIKNPLAIATGICDGMSLGANARAALVTRGLAELTRFGVALGAKAETFSGLAGLGDLLLTAVGDLSRNRQVGLQLAKGHTIDVILSSLGHVAEGVGTARILRQWAQVLNVDMPICTMIARILAQEVTPEEALVQLLARRQKPELDG